MRDTGSWPAEQDLQTQLANAKALAVAWRQQRDSALEAHAQVHANLLMKEAELQQARREAQDAIKSLTARIAELEALSPAG